jgi:hypothetical protein
VPYGIVINKKKRKKKGKDKLKKENGDSTVWA